MMENEIIKTLKKYIEQAKNNHDNYIAEDLQEAFDLINNQREEKKTMQENIDCLKAQNTRLQQNLEEAHIDIREHMAKNDSLKSLLDDKCDRCMLKDKSDAMKELAREIINDVLPKYLYGRETQALQIGFAISEKVNELTRKE